ncbi:MAG: ATP-binding protein [Coriobacteriales bacterium]|nr:ATP-binding protein [Coriobacteriales bacterium]
MIIFEVNTSINRGLGDNIMLIRGIVENFKSFDQKTELSMVSSSKIRKLPEHVTQIDGVKVLKHAAVYGANASGKSNLIEFLRFFQRTVGMGLSLGSSRQWCRTREENERKESFFELQFSVGDDVYAYGFTALLATRKITSEWLYDLKSRPAKMLLEWDGNSPEPTTSLALNAKDRARFDTYAEDFEGGGAIPFLTELNRSKRIPEDSPLFVFLSTFRWLKRNFITLEPMQPIPTRAHYFDEGGRRRLAELLSGFDTGVSEITERELQEDELVDVVPRNVLKNALDEAERLLFEGEDSTLKYSLRGKKSSFVLLEVSTNGELRASSLQIKHGAGQGVFEFGEESEGTQRLFDLAEILLSQEDDVTFVIDELERSLHPMLVRRFLKLFSDINSKHRRQLLFSTHEASIMDQELFRRDEIWFMDRSSDGASKLYSLDRFKERYDKDVLKSYLQGRYGAVPVFKDYVLEGGGRSDVADSRV